MLKLGSADTADDRSAGEVSLQSRPIGRSIDIQATFCLLIGGLVLPNIMAIVGGIWIGVPTRSTAIAAYAAVALLCSLVPKLFIAPLFLLALAMDVLGIVAHVFFLNLSLIGENIPAFNHVKIVACPLYLEFAIANVLFVVANVGFLMRYRSKMARGNRGIFGVLVVAALLFDIQANGSANLEVGPSAGIGKPFESAVKMSGFDSLTEADRPRRNVLFVLVESLGFLRDVEQRKLLFHAFRDPALTDRFAITMGTTSFYGPTAYGEMRELCGVRAAYTVVLSSNPPSCLPAAYAARGYRTVSVHGFTSQFYDRLSWYPKIGFIRSVFEETTNTHYGRRCGGPFVGLCDVDIADVISERLATASQPMFVYWLTLNSHVPVRAEEATPRHDCTAKGPFGDPEVCAMVEIWEDLFDAVSRLALRNPDTEILLVGDHAPPLWRRDARRQFKTDRVPWIRLSPRTSLTRADAAYTGERVEDPAGSLLLRH